MRNRRYVTDGTNLYTGSLNSTYRSLPTRPRSLYKHVHLFQAKIFCGADDYFRCLPGCERSALPGTLKT